MAITYEDLTGVTENVARVILLHARTIAPCIVNLAEDSQEKKDAVAVLMGVAAELPAPGERRLKSMSRNGTAVTLETAAAAFTANDESSLRTLCGSVAAPGLPRASFPVSAVLGRLWPEEPYT